MRIAVTAKPRSRRPGITKIDDATFVVAVKEAPEDGRATAAVLAVVAAYFDVPRTSVRLVSGMSSRSKVFEITGAPPRGPLNP
jgi:uncharacterized protein YggU (UPF0235/DUF167 family)